MLLLVTLRYFLSTPNANENTEKSRSQEITEKKTSTDDISKDLNINASRQVMSASDVDDMLSSL